MLLQEALTQMLSAHTPKPELLRQAENLAERLKTQLNGCLPYPVRAVSIEDSLVRNTCLLPLHELGFWIVLELPNVDEAQSPAPIPPSPAELLTALETCLNERYPSQVQRDIRSLQLKTPHARLTKVMPVLRGRMAGRDESIWWEGDGGISHWVPGAGPSSDWLPADPRMLTLDLQSLSPLRPDGTSLATDVVRLVKLWNNQQHPNLSRYYLEVMVSRLPTLPPQSLLAAFESAMRGLSSLVQEPCPDPNVQGLFADYEVTAPFKGRMSRALLRTADEVQRILQLEQEGRTLEGHALLAGIFGEAYPVQGESLQPLHLHLNVRPGAPLEGWQPFLPEIPSDRQLRWREEGEGPALSAPSASQDPIPWDPVGLATHRLAQKALRLRDRTDGPSAVFITGQAPLPVFLQLGLELNAWTSPVTLLNGRKDGTVDRIRLGYGLTPVTPRQGDADPAPSAPLFDVVTGIQSASPSQSTGQVVIFVSTVGTPPPRELISALLKAQHRSLAGLVEVRSSRPALLTGDNAVDAYNLLSSTLSSLRSAYPSATGFSVIVAGPAPLAFMVGRALNPTILPGIEAWNFEAGQYVRALELPFQGGEKAGPALRFKRLVLEGYRGFTQATLETSLTSSAQTLMLIGNNGAGKSSVLMALSLMLQALVHGWRGGSWSPRLSPQDLHTPGFKTLSLTLTVDLDGEDVSWKVSFPDDKKRPHTDLKALKARVAALRQTYGDSEGTNLPLMVYYPVHRSVPETSFRRPRRGEALGMTQLTAWEDALGEGESNFRDFFFWFKEREDLENKEKVRNAQHQDPQLQAVRRALKTLLPDFDRPGIERSPDRMVILKGGQPFEVRQLSDGEKVMLALGGDLARRLIIANPSLLNPLKGSGIVLIDEVELHLHPDWQRKIVPRLMETFQGCQFILTTHSPQVLGELQDAALFSLELPEQEQNGPSSPGNGLQITPMRSVYGWDSNLILTTAMNADERSKEITEQLKRLQEQLASNRLTEARETLRALAKTLEPDDPILTRAEIRLKRREVLGR